MGSDVPRGGLELVVALIEVCEQGLDPGADVGLCLGEHEFAGGGGGGDAGAVEEILDFGPMGRRCVERDGGWRVGGRGGALRQGRHGWRHGLGSRGCVAVE